MDTKNIEQLIDTTLNLLYDLNGHKSKDKVIELLQSEVFSKIDKENFVVIFDDIRRVIGNNPKNEIKIFEKAIKYFGAKNEKNRNK